MLAGFIAPTAGRILWDGRDIGRLPPAERPLTLLFQEHNLFAHLTAAQNVGLGLRPDLRLGPEGWDAGRRGAGRGRARRLRAAPARAALGRPAPAGGARALDLRNRPKVLLLDEPFAALGPALRDEMLDLVARIRDEQGATLLMVTHAPADARRIADQIVLVEDGRTHAPVATAALLDNPTPALATYLGSG